MLTKELQASVDAVVSLASWEPRFLEGVKRNIKENSLKECHVLYFEEFENMSNENINSVKDYCLKNGVIFSKSKINYKRPLKTRIFIGEYIDKMPKNVGILLDISTMTREVIWFLLDAMRDKIGDIQFVYWKPEEMGDWTSKNSSRPRLVIGRAGVSEFGKPTLVALTTGFDRSRLDQMIGYFEPERAVLFIQTGEQYENHEKNIRKHQNYILGGVQAEEYQIDCYSSDHGLSVISQALNPYLGTHNLVLASFGPKPSALAFHEFSTQNPSVALAYTPALDFNRQYSSGIAEAVCGTLETVTNQIVV